MELEKLINEIQTTEPKPGFKKRLEKVRAIVSSDGTVLNLESVTFENFESHTNHSDWDNRTKSPAPLGKLVRLKTITLKAVSEITGHTDHSDHNDFNNIR